MILFRACIVSSVLILTHVARAQTAPTDPSLDWLMSQAKPAGPTSEPTIQETSPLQTTNKNTAGRPATLTLGDGTTLRGDVSTTPGKPIRIWDEEAKQYLDLPLSRLALVEAEVVWERDEREWQFKQAGSDEKVYSGKSYPARELVYNVTLNDGMTLRGGIVAPIEYTDSTTGRSQIFVLHKRDKGPVGQTLAQLVYVKEIKFAAPTTRPLLP